MSRVGRLAGSPAAPAGAGTGAGSGNVAGAAGPGTGPMGRWGPPSGARDPRASLRPLRRRPRAAPTVGGAIRLLAAVSSALRAGATPDAAWARAGVPTRAGLPEEVGLAAVLPPAALAPVLAAVRLAQEVGAPLAAVLDRIARFVERSGEAADRRAEALAGPRTTATLLAWLPASGLVLGLVLGVDPLAVLLDGAGGTGLLAVGLALTALGRSWTRRLIARAAAGGEPVAAGLLDLLDVALTSGADLPRALAAVGAVTGPAGGPLTRAAGRLALGADWVEAWTGAPDDVAPVAVALEPAWAEGTAPGPALRAAAETARRAAHTAALEAAGRLAVTIVLPLGLCHLPAFVAVGLVPVLVSMAGGMA